MKRKKFLAVLTTSALLMGMLAGCGTEDTPTELVDVWATGSVNVEKTFGKLVQDFNEQHNGVYTARLHFVPLGAEKSLSELLVFAYRSNKPETEFDVVELGDDDLSKIVSETDEEILMKLDMDKVPNAEGVTVRPVTASGRAQPYRGTTVMLAYNAETVPEAEVPGTMEELTEWIKAHPGRFAYNAPGLDGAGDSFVRSVVYNQIEDEDALMSDALKWEEEWDEGFAQLKELHPYLYRAGGVVTYPQRNGDVLSLLAQGKLDMCPSWMDMALEQQRRGILPENIKLSTIEPALTGSVPCAAVPSFSGNKEGGTAFVNYLLSPEAQTILVQEMAAIPLKTEGVDMTGAEELLQMDVAGFRTQALGDLIADLNQRWRQEIASIREKG